MSALNEADMTGSITLGNLFQVAGLAPEDIMVIRHTMKPDGLASEAEAAGPQLMEFAREQDLKGKIVPNPPRIWLNFLATTGRRARFLRAFENKGEVLGERTATNRYFDLQESEVYSALRDRLVIEWSGDTVNWAKIGPFTLKMPVIEIADPHMEPFPGFDALLVEYDQLEAIIRDDRFAHWRTALGSVQGIYLIADRKTGQLYVGKADGVERILGRWSSYARTGHGGNVALRSLDGLDPTHRKHFQFSLLQVFDPNTATAKIDAAETHFKNALLTRHYGLNRN